MKATKKNKDKTFVKFTGDVPVEVLQAAIQQTAEMFTDRYFAVRATSAGEIELVWVEGLIK